MSALGIPQFDRLLVVFAAGHDQALLRVPMDALDICAVAPEHLLLGAAVKVPNSEGSVVTTRREFIVRWAETEKVTSPKAIN